MRAAATTPTSAALGLLLLGFIAFSKVNGNCFEYDIDYDGTNLNNGLEQKTTSAQACQDLCQLIQDCQGFTWASEDFVGIHSHEYSQGLFLLC